MTGDIPLILLESSATGDASTLAAPRDAPKALSLSD
jgi:hypothetical protein